MSWDCECGITNRTSARKCRGCGWTREQLAEWRQRSNAAQSPTPTSDSGCFVIPFLLAGCVLLLFGVAELMELIAALTHVVKPDESSPNVSSGAAAMGIVMCLALCGMGVALLYVALSQRESGGPENGAPRDAAQSVENEMKKCPACDESIRLEAVKCTFCGSEFDADSVSEAVTERKAALAGRLKAAGFVTQEGLEGEAFCLGCRTTGPRSQMLYNEGRDTFYHVGCLPKGISAL